MALLTNSLLVLPQQQLGPSQTQSPATIHFNHSQRCHHFCRATSSVSLWFCNGTRKVKSLKTKASKEDKQEVKLEEKKEEEEEFQVPTVIKSGYNDIVILGTPKSRMLLLDSSHNVHSIVYKHQKCVFEEFKVLIINAPTNYMASYIFILWFILACIVILNLNLYCKKVNVLVAALCGMNFLACMLLLQKGGGTAAHVMLDLCPSLQLAGWETDQIASILLSKGSDVIWTVAATLVRQCQERL